MMLVKGKYFTTAAKRAFRWLLLYSQFKPIEAFVFQLCNFHFLLVPEQVIEKKHIIVRSVEF